jgi:ribose 5-phosphate isomerase B
LGMALAAGKYADVRAVSLSDCFSAKMAREHSDANILCLGGRVVGPGLAAQLMRTWLTSDFLGGKYAERLQMMRGGYRSTSK